MAKFTSHKTADAETYEVRNGPMVVEKGFTRTEARTRAAELNAPKGEQQSEPTVDVAAIDPALATMDETELGNRARDEHRAQQAAKKAGQPVPPAPHLDELHRRHAGGQLKHQNGNGKKGSSGAGRTVRLDDAALVEQLTALVQDEGVASKGAAIKRLREIGKGSNGKRVAKAWDAMLKSGVKLPDGKPSQFVKDLNASKRPAGAKKATSKKAAPSKAAAKKATPRKTGAAAKLDNAKRSAPKKSADKTAKDIGREAAASKAIAERRSARKAS